MIQWNIPRPPWRSGEAPASRALGVLHLLAARLPWWYNEISPGLRGVVVRHLPREHLGCFICLQQDCHDDTMKYAPASVACLERTGSGDRFPLFTVEFFQWLRNRNPMATFPGACRYRFSTRSGSPCISILWLCALASLISSFCVSAATLCICFDVKQPKIKSPQSSPPTPPPPPTNQTKTQRPLKKAITIEMCNLEEIRFLICVVTWFIRISVIGTCLSSGTKITTLGEGRGGIPPEWHNNRREEGLQLREARNLICVLTDKRFSYLNLRPLFTTRQGVTFLFSMAACTEIVRWQLR